MNKSELLNDIAKLANKYDKLGQTDVANKLDLIIRRAQDDRTLHSYKEQNNTEQFIKDLAEMIGIELDHNLEWYNKEQDVLLDMAELGNELAVVVDDKTNTLYEKKFDDKMDIQEIADTLKKDLAEWLHNI